jgi:hypothetical protein
VTFALLSVVHNQLSYPLGTRAILHLAQLATPHLLIPMELCQLPF